MGSRSGSVHPDQPRLWVTPGAVRCVLLWGLGTKRLFFVAVALVEVEPRMPAWLLWLLPLPLATVGAIAWTSWSARSRRPVEAFSSVEDFERFRAALTAHAPRRSRRRRAPVSHRQINKTSHR